MSDFMEPQVVENDWLEVDVAGLICWIPADIVCVNVPEELKSGEITEDSLREYFTDNYKSWAGGPDKYQKIAEQLAKEARDKWVAIQRQLKDYCDESCWPGREGELIQSVKFVHGWGARLSAPGYMDCTEWSVFQTEKEAEYYLQETYPSDDEDGEAEDDTFDIAQHDNGTFFVTKDGEDIAGPFKTWEATEKAIKKLRKSNESA